MPIDVLTTAGHRRSYPAGVGVRFCGGEALVYGPDGPPGGGPDVVLDSLPAGAVAAVERTPPAPYGSPDPPPPMTPAEAAALTRAGLEHAALWYARAYREMAGHAAEFLNLARHRNALVRAAFETVSTN